MMDERTLKTEYPFHYSRELPQRNNLTMPPVKSQGSTWDAAAMRHIAHGLQTPRDVYRDIVRFWRDHDNDQRRGHDPYNHLGDRLRKMLGWPPSSGARYGK